MTKFSPAIIMVDGVCYESIGDFQMFNKVQTDPSTIYRYIKNISSGDYIRLPLKLFSGGYEVFNIYKI